MARQGEVTHISKLREEVNNLPRLPGVYLMRDAENKVIYVGKAKSLRNRVRTYFLGGDGRHQVQFLMKRVDAVETIVTENEQQAFILERDLIAKYHPRYNIRLKDDKAYLSIRIDENAPWPKLELVRRVEQDGARYFGPYSFSYQVRELLEIINKVVPLRSCTDAVFYNRQRPCLEHQIKRCAGPCCLPVDRDDYAGWVKQAIAILEGKTAELERELGRRMEKASEELRFEDAAVLRDRLEVLKNFRQGQRFLSHDGEDRDVFSLYREERLAALSVLMVRSGRVVDNRNFTFSDVEVADEEVLAAALSQYYNGEREMPPEVVLPVELEDESLLKEGLREKYGRAPALVVPQRGIRLRLLNLALLNAKQHYLAVFDAESRYQEIAVGLSRLLQLSQVPRRIECVDISNLQGSDIVGAIVAFFDGSPDKSAYKRYKISRQDKPDDFAAIHEVVYRRLRRCLDDEGEQAPDLFLIDGGPGQLAKALEARDELGVRCEIAALAKLRKSSLRLVDQEVSIKPERIYKEGVEEPLILDPAADSTRFLARVRDEAHRFVIRYHRSSRAKRVFSSVLDQVSGIGPERKRRLIAHFGSVKKMAAAGLDDLARVGRMPRSLAQKLQQKLSEIK